MNKRRRRRESESRHNEQPWSSGVCQKRRTEEQCREWEEAQYQSMVQARELELETPEATPSFALLVFPVINRPGVDSKDRRLSSQCSKW